MLLSLLLPAAASLVSANVAHAANQAPDAFNWPSIVPSEQLQYHNCYNGFKCARLAVPLDWKNPEHNLTAAIALIKLPAVVPDDDPTFGGTIIFNPGGPGLSGVDAALKGAKIIQKTLTDKPGVRHYEIVSFDPRGVGRTTPTSDCFRSDELARTALIFEDRGKGPISYGKPSLAYGMGLVKYFSDHCKAEEEVKGAMEFVNTPSVARDMVEMIDRIDELRKREAAQKHGGQRPQRPPTLAKSPVEDVGDEDEQVQESAKGPLVPRASQEDENPLPRIQYLGFSYGTVLGNTFASMFPGRVGRMVLDGVINAKDYYNGDGKDALDDTHKMVTSFWRGCYEAKISICPFRLNPRPIGETQKQFWRWLRLLNRFPEAVPTANGGVMVVRGSDVLFAIGSALYSPVTKFHRLAMGIYDGMTRNDMARIAALIDEDVDTLGAPQFKAEQAWGVICGDGPDYRNHDVEFWSKYYQGMEKLSRVHGPFWSQFRLACSSWPYRPNWEFKSGFKTPTPSSDPLYAARPAAPLLFLSSQFDPIAPLSGARAMAKGHPNSGILVQQSMGHTTLGGGPSRCTWEAVRNYFHDGKIQAREFSCSAECDPWDNECEQNGDENWGVWTNMTAAFRGVLRPRPWSLGGM